MAKINSGILGGFSGTISNITGYRHKGKSIITAKLQKTVRKDSIQKINSIRMKDFRNTLQYFENVFLRMQQFGIFIYKIYEWNQIFTTNFKFYHETYPINLPTLIIINSKLLFVPKMSVSYRSGDGQFLMSIKQLNTVKLQYPNLKWRSFSYNGNLNTCAIGPERNTDYIESIGLFYNVGTSGNKFAYGAMFYDQITSKPIIFLLGLRTKP